MKKCLKFDRHKTRTKQEQNKNRKDNYMKWYRKKDCWRFQTKVTNIFLSHGPYVIQTYLWSALVAITIILIL